ncbi:MAG: PA14 domain-containing protein [Planctomycetota bacterium]|nr:PA14 domain-containing protein [Planctomycetota bacterium]
MRLLLILLTSLLLVSTAWAADEAAPTAPTSPAATQAKLKFEAAIGKAKESAAAAIGSAREQYLASVQKAFDTAMQSANLDDAKWAKGEIEQVKAGGAASTERAKMPVVAIAQTRLAKAGERATEDYIRAVDVVRRQYLTDLENARRVVMSESKDLEEATRIGAEIDRAKTMIVDPALPGVPASSSGKSAAAYMPPAEADLRGLKFEWFNGRNFNVKIGERIDYKIATEFGYGSAGTGGQTDDFSVRWTGFMRAPKPGRYKLSAVADDGYRVKLSGKVVMESWDSSSDQSTWVDFTGDPQEICFEMCEHGAWAMAKLYWTPPGETDAAIVPPTVFFQTKEAAKSGRWQRPAGVGLSMVVFDDKDLRNQTARDFDENIDWPFGNCLIASGLRSNNMAIRWEGFIVAPEPGAYRLNVHVDDGIRLWIDRKILMDSWKSGDNSQAITVDFDGAPHSFVVEFCVYGRPNHISLHWTKTGGFDEQVIPPSAFFLTKAAADQAIARRKAAGGK